MSAFYEENTDTGMSVRYPAHDIGVRSRQVQKQVA